jgi:hypothetical protein
MTTITVNPTFAERTTEILSEAKQIVIGWMLALLSFMFSADGILLVATIWLDILIIQTIGLSAFVAWFCVAWAFVVPIYFIIRSV